MKQDTETRRAIAAVTRILTAAEPGTAPEVTAAHIVTSMRGHGWRPTAAQPPPPWQPDGTPPSPPTSEYRQARAAITREEPA